MEYMGADYEGALRLIKETMVELRKDYDTKILLASSDGSFADKIIKILGDRFSSVPLLGWPFLVPCGWSCWRQMWLSYTFLQKRYGKVGERWVFRDATTCIGTPIVLLTAVSTTQMR